MPGLDVRRPGRGGGVGAAAPTRPRSLRPRRARRCPGRRPDTSTTTLVRRAGASAVRDVEGFPQPGVTFKDITPVLADAAAFAEAVNWLAAPFAGRADKVAAIEARGFILGAPVAYALGTGLVPVRKVGKLPAATMAQSYVLEYGEAVLEMHTDAVEPGDRVLIVDDVIATGGTLHRHGLGAASQWGRGRRGRRAARDRGPGRPGAARRTSTSTSCCRCEPPARCRSRSVDAQEERFAAAFAAGDISVAQSTVRARRRLHQPHDTALRMAGAHRRGRAARSNSSSSTITGLSDISYAVDERALIADDAGAYVRVRFDFDMRGERLRSTYVVVYRYRDGADRPAGAVLRPQRRSRAALGPMSDERPIEFVRPAGLYRDAPYAYARGGTGGSARVQRRGLSPRRRRRRGGPG